MLAYSNQTVLSYAKTHPAIGSHNLGCDGAAGSTYVMVYGIGDDLGKEAAFQVNNEAASAGQKHAIVATAPVMAAPAC
jgi:hypothetical protein